MYQPPEGSNFGPYPSTPQQPHGGGGPAGGPAVSGKEQAIMWQQGHYMGGESGFISASTTQPSSITGHEDDLDSAANCFTGPGSITGSSIYDLDSAHVSGECEVFYYFVLDFFKESKWSDIFTLTHQMDLEDFKYYQTN